MFSVCGMLRLGKEASEFRKPGGSCYRRYKHCSATGLENSSDMTRGGNTIHGMTNVCAENAIGCAGRYRNRCIVCVNERYVFLDSVCCCPLTRELKIVL